MCFIVQQRRVQRAPSRHHFGPESLYATNPANLHSTDPQAALAWRQSLLIWMQTYRSVAVQIQMQLMEREEGLCLLASVTPVPESAVTF